MKPDWLFYSALFVVVLFSFLSVAFLPIPDEFRNILTVPGFFALITLVVEAWRDKRTHERNLDLLSRQQANSLAIASHMATVIFDRQVEFCETYFELAHNILLELFTTGPTKIALTKAHELYRIRFRYSPWLSPQIESGLLPFEKALREIGSSAQMVEMNLPQPQHELFVKKMFDAFIKISDISEPLEGDSPEEAISSIITHLRNVVGVNQLTNLRDQAIQTATIRNEKSKSFEKMM